MHPEIIETKKMVNNWQEYTGNYRLIGIPGEYMDLPGHGGKRTKDAAVRALKVFEAGGSWEEARQAAWQKSH